MKKQNNPTIQAHLIRRVFHVLLLVAACTIPFALAQKIDMQVQHSSTSSSHPSGGICSNYTTSTSTGTIVPGTTDIGNHCDDCTTNITFPFQISLYGSTFTSGNVGSNGNLQFTNPSNYFGSDCPLPNGSLDEAILPYQDDLSTDPAISPDCSMFASGCGIFTSVSGSAPDRIFYIEWRTGYFGRAGTANFELVFYENNPSCFDVIYGSTVDNGLSEASGVQQSAAGPATTFSCHEATLTDGLRVTYCCAGGTPTPTATGTPTATATVTSTATATATVTPSATVTATVTPTATVTATVTPTATATATATVTPTATATVTATVTPTATPSGGCVRGQGYWKNHPEAWPVTELQLGNVTYTQEQLLAILHEPVRGNGLVLLAHQLIAALLNIANGADPTCIQQAIDEANALIGDLVIPPVGDGYLSPRDVAPLAGILGGFNEGDMCAPACEANPSPTTTPIARRARPNPRPR